MLPIQRKKQLREETENLAYKMRNTHAGYNRTISASNVVPCTEEVKVKKSWVTEQEEDREQSKEENEEGKEHEFEEKNGEERKKHNLRCMVRDKKRLFGKYGSLEDVLPPKKESNKNRRNYEGNNKEDVTPNQKVQTHAKETMREKEDWMDLKDTSQEIEEWEQDETEKNEERKKKERKKERKKEKKKERKKERKKGRTKGRKKGRKEERKKGRKEEGN